MEAMEKAAAMADGAKGAEVFDLLREAAEAAAKGQLSEAMGRQILSKMARSSTGEALRFFTVRQWGEEWQGIKRTVTKPATAERYRASVAAFMKHLGPKADGRLEALTKADVRSFRDHLRARGLTGKTCNCRLKDIVGMLRAAVREGLLLASPATGIEALPEDDSVSRVPFTLAEVGKLVQAAGRPDWQKAIFRSSRGDEESEQMAVDWQGLILTGFYTGMRLGDAANIDGTSRALPHRVFRIIPAKTSRKKKRLEIPMHPRLINFFEELDASRGKPSGAVFPSLCGRAVSGNVGLSQMFNAIMEAAGVDPMEVVTGDRKRRVRLRGYHSLRHTLTSNLANADVPEEIRRRITGHETREAHQIYTHTETATLARALEKLPTV